MPGQNKTDTHIGRSACGLKKVPPTARPPLALSEKFWGCECFWGEEEKRKPETAKFKTAKDVKAGLKKMGF